MTEDFASDMYLLRDLLLLAEHNKQAETPEWNVLNAKLASLEGKATELMKSVQELKRAFNERNRNLMMGLWVAGFVDPLDPPNGQKPEFDENLTEAELIKRAKETGILLNSLFDELKFPHYRGNDAEAQGDELKTAITNVRNIKEVADNLQNDYKRLREMLDRMIAAFNPKGGGGTPSTYWPSNYVSSSSSSSTTYP
jgi:hypothetical protein